MKMISPKTAVIAIIVIMVSAYFYDFPLFQVLLGWLLGGVIVQLVGIAVFGSLIGNLMKNPEIQEMLKLFKEAKTYLKQILENQKNHQTPGGS